MATTTKYVPSGEKSTCRAGRCRSRVMHCRPVRVGVPARRARPRCRRRRTWRSARGLAGRTVSDRADRDQPAAVGGEGEVLDPGPGQAGRGQLASKPVSTAPVVGVEPGQRRPGDPVDRGERAAGVEPAAAGASARTSPQLICAVKPADPRRRWPADSRARPRCGDAVDRPERAADVDRVVRAGGRARRPAPSTARRERPQRAVVAARTRRCCAARSVLRSALSVTAVKLPPTTTVSPTTAIAQTVPSSDVRGAVDRVGRHHRGLGRCRRAAGTMPAMRGGDEHGGGDQAAAHRRELLRSGVR